MSKYSHADHYLDPASGVLKNLLGITHALQLEKQETDYSTARSYELAKQPISGAFDLTHLQAIHRWLFGDLYAWAGELRTIDITKGTTRFAHFAHIETAASPVFQQLAHERYLTGLTTAAFSDRAAHYLGEINALHPFREGNGRAQREFINHLAYRNGQYIDWKHISPAEMVQASIESFHGDCSKFAAYIGAHLHSR